MQLIDAYVFTARRYMSDVWVCTWHPDVFVESKSILLYWGWSFNYTWIKSDNILPYSQPGFQESYFKWCRLRLVNFQENHEPWETIFSLVRHTYNIIAELLTPFLTRVKINNGMGKDCRFGRKRCAPKRRTADKAIADGMRGYSRFYLFPVIRLWFSFI